MNAWMSYIATLAVFGLVDIIALLGLNLQQGFGGVVNLAYVAYIAIGGYAYAVVSVGSPSLNGGFQHFFGGVQLPFPLPLLVGAAAGCVAGALSGLLLMRRLRIDYQALAFYALFFAMFGIATTVPGFLNGSAGLSLIPAPLAGTLGLSAYSVSYAWVFVALALVVAAICFWLVRRLVSTPWGRLLRAIREDELACAALGKRSGWIRYQAFVVGCGLAALSGALLAAFLSTWGPASWGFSETLLFYAALVVGGMANNWGAVIGAVLVQVIIVQLPQFLPAFVSGQTLGSIQVILIALMIMAFLWFRPQGLLPERYHKYSNSAAKGNLPEPLGYVRPAATDVGAGGDR